LDETDSGLDIDALKAVGQAIERLRSKDRSIILITHYQRLLDFIQPDVVHVMQNGKIVRSGNKDLAKILEAEGYESFC
jgi:Fe-S cluster assembly ATP-binding protein